MHDKDTLMREQTRFLGQEPERLRGVRGPENKGRNGECEWLREFHRVFPF